MTCRWDWDLICYDPHSVTMADYLSQFFTLPDGKILRIDRANRLTDRDT